MCVNPGRLADGTEIACRKCWQCRENRINDWVGRCIAESKTALACSSIELTYGRDQYGSSDHASALILTYSDVQKYFKLLRRHGFPCRYFVTGEFGTLKGRAHWHLVVFWLERVPPFAGMSQGGEWSSDHKRTRFMHYRVDDEGAPVYVEHAPAMYWPHGWSFVESVSYESVRYKTKYIQKDIGEMERQGHLSMSKKPPLGTAYFLQMAEKHVEQGLSPRDLKYSFPEVRDGSGKKREFLLSGKTAELFLAHFVASWMAQRPGQAWPSSPLVDQFVDPERTEQQIAEALADRKFDQKFTERLLQIEWARNAPFVGGIWNGPAYRDLRGENGA